jgi:hypothetical protein
VTLLEIHLIPQHCIPRTMQRVKIVNNCLAPSRTMAGAKTLTVRARRLGKHQWEAFWIPLGWRQREPIIPRINEGVAWIDEAAPKIYWFARQTEIVVGPGNLSRGALGPDVRIVGFDHLSCRHSQQAAQIGQLVRRVFYLTIDPLDGLTTTPDETCVSPIGRKLIGRNEPSERAIRYGQDRCADYLAELAAKAKGLVRGTMRTWVTPEQYAAELAYQNQQRR